MNVTTEWKTIILICVAIVLFSQLPLILGYATQSDSEVFMGIPVHITDANNHLHWMKQAQDGAIFFTNKFTYEDVPSLIFNPYHFIIGKLAALTSLNILFWYHLVSILAIFGFLLYLYYFISNFVKDKQTRLVAFLVTSLAAGFGALWKLSKIIFDKWIVSADLWVTDMNVFESFGHPHFTIAMLLMLVVFLHGYRAIEKDNFKDALIAGLFGLLLGFIHIFDIVTVAAVLFGWFVYKCLLKKKFLVKPFLKLVVMGSAMSLPVMYYLWIIAFNPTYAQWNALNQTVTPNIFALVSGFGLLFFFAVVQLYQERKHLSFLGVWVIINFVLVYLPINVQRRFLLGIGIPLAILCAQAYVHTIKPWFKEHGVAFYGIFFTVILLFGTTAYLTYEQIQQLHNPDTDDFSNVKYLSVGEVNALSWIDENLNNDIIIISPLRIGNHIPANTNNRVYLGHWAQTIYFEDKKAEIDKLYAGEENEVVGDIVWNGIVNEDRSNIAYENSEITLTYR